ncbi:MAG: DNA repair protein RecN [Sinobacteraceae bacterium]|nr:DNA repair protein RecN [Nevskiaceae bacterium]
MLTHLHIRDFAIIDSIEIDLRAGLTVLTGETGAGKSILVDALQLAAGGRAGIEVVRHGSERAEVTATFDLTRAPAPLRELLGEQSIDADDELVVRRVVTREGKSRAYLNGQQVSIQTLRLAGEWLVDIHGQHEFQSLARPAAQRDLLDEFGDALALAAAVAAAHRERLAASARLTALQAMVGDRDSRLELLRFQTGELAALEFTDGELQTLGEERTRLANRGRLADAARGTLALLYEAEDSNAHAATSRALALLRQAGSLDPRLGAVQPLVDEALIRIAEAARELAGYLDDLDVDPARQEFVEQRLAAIEQLARKHRVAAAELPARSAQLQAELAQLERVEHDLATLQAEVAAAAENWRRAAATLSSRRRTIAAKLGPAITQRMQTLGMAGGRFEVRIEPLPLDPAETSPHGLEQIEFLVSANPGQPPRPLGKVASGGELSRLSLAVQVTTARADGAASRDSRCMVFDEVDSGVGGAVAEIVGRELAALGRQAQVLCVTHLPQVAAQGDEHLRVAKLTDGRSTRTQLVELTGGERVEEIARMLGGVSITDKAREHASEMLKGAAATPLTTRPRAAARGRRAKG